MTTEKIRFTENPRLKNKVIGFALVPRINPFIKIIIRSKGRIVLDIHLHDD